MKILAVVHCHQRGGAQESTIELLKLLRSRGVDITILIGESTETTFRSEIESLDMPTVTARGRMIGNYPDVAVENHPDLIKSTDLVWIPDIEYLVAPRIKKIKKDIPIIAHLRSYAIACPIESAFYGMREACTVNCSHSLRRFAGCQRLSKEYAAQWHQKSTMRRVTQLLNFPKSYLDFTAWPMNEGIVESIDGFVSISRYTRDLVRVHLPQLHHVPVEVIPNPVMVPEIASAAKKHQESRTILYASGPYITKGPHLALYAVRRLLDEDSKEFTLTMLATAGNVWIKNLVKRLRLEGRVSLLGVSSREQVSVHMADSSVVLFPSLWPEPFGRIPAEANLLGTPAVVSNRGGLPDTIVDNVTGLVTEPSVEELARSLDEALEREWNRELIAHISKERFDPERIINDFMRFLNTFI